MDLFINNSSTANADDEFKVDFSYFTKDNVKVSDTGTSIEDKPKRTRKSSNKNSLTVDSINPEVLKDENDISQINYARTYTETAGMLRGAIAQADEMNAEIKQDIENVRSSKTLKNKYTYITNLTASAGSLLSTKIAAIRELNSSITQSHNLELNRAKTLKLNEASENDEMRMMDIYSAFINTPVGAYTPQAPTLQDLNLGTNAANPTVNPIEMMAPNSDSVNLTPEQIRMRMESNPNIQAVVRYNQATGQRCFDVIDKSTGASVPNFPRPDNFLLEDTTIDISSGIARNRNINQVWPLVIDGGAPMTEY